MKKVVKFGGSSLASAAQFEKVGKIIRSEETRKYVVPSAPGKRNPDDTKVTDMLYKCYALAEMDKTYDKLLSAIKDRYDSIIEGLGINFSLDSEFQKIDVNFRKKAGTDYAASRGEYLNGMVMAAYLEFPFVDAAEVIRFDDDGTFDPEMTNSLMREKLQSLDCAVIPGFYGSYADGYDK